MSVYHKLRRFVQAHQRCGVLRSNMESATGTGFLLWIVRAAPALSGG
jgi:hypothetical protein